MDIKQERPNSEQFSKQESLSSEQFSEQESLNSEHERLTSKQEKVQSVQLWL